MKWLLLIIILQTAQHCTEALGEPCSGNKNCNREINEICQNKICVCRSGFSGRSGTCSQLEHGDNCTVELTATCPPPLVCTASGSGENKCLCDPIHDSFWYLNLCRKVEDLAVSNLNYLDQSGTSISLGWTPGIQPIGVQYQVEWENVQDPSNRGESMTHSRTGHVFSGLTPASEYNLTVTASLPENDNYPERHIATFGIFWTTIPADIWGKKKDQLTDEDENQATDSTFSVVLNRDALDTLSQERGPMEEMALIVRKRNPSINSTDIQNGRLSYAQFSKLPTWAEAKKTNFSTAYRTTSRGWGNEVLKGSGSTSVFTVGEDTDCDPSGTTYCNGPVPAESEFVVSNVVCYEQCTVTQSEDVYNTKKYELNANLDLNVGGGLSGGQIAGIVIGVLAALIVLIGCGGAGCVGFAQLAG